MELRFKKQHLSLKELPDTALPKFSLITGVNGAGKTHLLGAIATGAIAVDIAPNIQTDIRFLDWSSLQPNDVSEVTAATIYQDRDQLLAFADGARNQHASLLNDLFSKFGIARKWLGDPWDIGRNIDQNTAKLGLDAPRREQFTRELRQVLTQTSNAVSTIQQIQSNLSTKVLLQEAARECDGFAALLRQEDFRGRHFGWGKADLFQQSFAHLFYAYFELQRTNMMHRVVAHEGGAAAGATTYGRRIHQEARSAAVGLCQPNSPKRTPDV